MTSYDGGGEECSYSTALAAGQSTGRVTEELISFQIGEGGREVRSGVDVGVLSEDRVRLIGRKWQTGTSMRLHEIESVSGILC